MIKLATAKTQVIQAVLPKSLPTSGVSYSPTFNPSSSASVLTVPSRDSHTTDILDYRQSNKDSDIIAELAKTDSDVSAATSAYLATANTVMNYYCVDSTGAVDRNAQSLVAQIILNLTSTLDYSQGFTADRSLDAINAGLRYHILVSGACCGELIQNKAVAANLVSELRLVNPNSLEWYETENGKLYPVQVVSGQDDIDLNIPTFFHSGHHQDPNTAYSQSPFVSVINSIYARKRIIEDLYRMMNINGYPRIKIKVLEATILANAPDKIKRGTLVEQRAYINQFTASVSAAFQDLKADAPLVHSDSYEVDTINQKGAMSLDISPIISILNSQNQTALKTVGTILGRGENGTNTASAETRVFLKSAEDVNNTVARLWVQALNFALRLAGSTSYVKVFFNKPTFNSDVENAPNETIRQSILQKDLSLGIISDDEYALRMWGRLRSDSAPELSGTRFLNNTDLTTITNTPNDPTNQPDSYERTGTVSTDSSANDNNVA